MFRFKSNNDDEDTIRKLSEQYNTFNSSEIDIELRNIDREVNAVEFNKTVQLREKISFTSFEWNKNVERLHLDR